METRRALLCFRQITGDTWVKQSRKMEHELKMHLPKELCPTLVIFCYHLMCSVFPCPTRGCGWLRSLLSNKNTSVACLIPCGSDASTENSKTHKSFVTHFVAPHGRSLIFLLQRFSVEPSVGLLSSLLFEKAEALSLSEPVPWSTAGATVFLTRWSPTANTPMVG